MDGTQEQPPPLLARALRWLGAFEKAMNMRPVDHLGLRIAELERRFADNDFAADTRRSQCLTEV